MKSINSEITNKIAKQLGLTFVAEKEPEGNVCMVNSSEVRIEFRDTFSTIDLLNYINAVLHSSTDQEKNKELLKNHFLKIPFPKDLSTFQKLTNIGSQIRQNHLFENSKIEFDIIEFTIEGDYIVLKTSYSKSS